VSVDTYARKTNLKLYELLRHEGAEILVAKNLVSQAAGVTLELKKFLMFSERRPVRPLHLKHQPLSDRESLVTGRRAALAQRLTS
jgi:hypothetical protein